ncbi:HK97-gp10 family putative phage morphogenesis protein [uncultured Sphingomonas sp.]|uniref:HK97-gp10 family putative phage morphogenesis protein n=1 Tax=uncultured Sphingomonas sp. TaxID=158754 RepID=UPI00261788D1|nr:HK97-gp10 family putative phage morphogenesis protein [uncultured Sphingomonas sp.]
MTWSCKSEGFDKLDRQMAKMASGIPQDRQRDVLHRGGQLIVDEAQRLAPVRTGALRDSIRVTDDREGLLYGKLNGTGMSVYIGPVGSVEDGDVYYAKFQEFGTIHMRATPYMRPAIASKRPEAEKLVLTLLAQDVLGMAQ